MLKKREYSFRGIAVLRMVMMALFIMFIVSCMEKRTRDPEKAFRYWSGGEEPPMDVHVVQGQYWESPHFFKEFELYLEIYAPRKWSDALIQENHLQPGSEKMGVSGDTPGWFKPEGKMELFIDGPAGMPGVELYRDTTSGRLLLHVLQL